MDNVKKCDLQMIDKEDGSPSLKYVRCPKVEIFVEIFRANLEPVGVSLSIVNGGRLVMKARTNFLFKGTSCSNFKGQTFRFGLWHVT